MTIFSFFSTKHQLLKRWKNVLKKFFFYASKYMLSNSKQLLKAYHE